MTGSELRLSGGCDSVSIADDLLSMRSGQRLGKEEILAALSLFRSISLLKELPLYANPPYHASAVNACSIFPLTPPQVGIDFRPWQRQSSL